jgi:hypothetical protein
MARSSLALLGLSATAILAFGIPTQAQQAESSPPPTFGRI